MSQTGRPIGRSTTMWLASVVVALVLVGSACGESSDQNSVDGSLDPRGDTPAVTLTSALASDSDLVSTSGLTTTAGPADTRPEGDRRFEDISGMAPSTQPEDLDVDRGLNDEGAIACGHAEVAVVTFLTDGATPDVSRATADAADAATASKIDILVAEIPKLRARLDDPASWEKSIVQFLEACQSLGYETL